MSAPDETLDDVALFYQEQIQALQKAVQALSIQLGRIHQAALHHRDERRSARSWQTLFRECTKEIKL